MPTNQIKAVLFDLGETLLDFGKINTLKFFKEGARLSYDFLKNHDQPVGNFHIYCWRSLLSLRFHNFISDISGNDFDSLSLLKKLGISKGVKLTDEQWVEFVWLWYEPLSRICKTKPETAETLSQLKRQGIKLGVLSNTFVHSSALERHLKQLGILDLLDTRLYSYQFEYRKPDPRIFIQAADTIGERLPNIMYVGDRINMDINPTLKLDMYAVLKNAYTNFGKNLPKGARRITRINELPAIIEKINANSH